MFLILVSLVCLGISGPAPVQVMVVKHQLTPDVSVNATDAQCCDCPCWQAPHGECGCAIRGSCDFCGYINIAVFPDRPWGPFIMSDANGCIDTDLLPIPQEEWVFWIGDR